MAKTLNERLTGYGVIQPGANPEMENVGRRKKPPETPVVHEANRSDLPPGVPRTRASLERQRKINVANERNRELRRDRLMREFEQKYMNEK